VTRTAVIWIASGMRLACLLLFPGLAVWAWRAGGRRRLWRLTGGAVAAVLLFAAFAASRAGGNALVEAYGYGYTAPRSLLVPALLPGLPMVLVVAAVVSGAGSRVRSGAGRYLIALPAGILAWLAATVVMLLVFYRRTRCHRHRARTDDEEMTAMPEPRPMREPRVVRLDETERVSFGPLSHYQTLIGDEEGSTPFRTGIQTAQPGYVTPVHSHPYLEVLHILDGTAEAWLDGEEDRAVVLHKGDTIALPPNTPHAFRVVGDQVLRLLGTHASPHRIVIRKDGPDA
jgi:quercetin dioxygenase-like cupin family protein